MASALTSVSGTFAARWNELPRADRMRMRRLVRMGRQVDPPELQPLAAEYAHWQMQRPWMRFFWLWFVPGMFVVLGIAANIHPVFLGVAIALGAQAVYAHINLRKLARRAT